MIRLDDEDEKAIGRGEGVGPGAVIILCVGLGAMLAGALALASGWWAG